MVRLKITEVYGKRESKTRIGFRSGKVVALTCCENPWREIEIAPTELERISIHNQDDGHSYLRARATLSLTPELEPIFNEIFASKLIPMDEMFNLKSKGFLVYGTILPDVTPEEFMTTDFTNGIVVKGGYKHE